jgi:hypothetical protein
VSLATALPQDEDEGAAIDEAELEPGEAQVEVELEAAEVPAAESEPEPEAPAEKATTKRARKLPTRRTSRKTKPAADAQPTLIEEES